MKSPLVFVALTFGAALAIAPAIAADSAKPKRQILFFSKSSGFEHSVIKKTGDELSHAERVLKELGDKNNWEFTFSKDGSLFTAAGLKKFDAVFFYTTGDLTTVGKDGMPGMPPDGPVALIDYVRSGKGFIGTHSASDTFHTKSDRFAFDGDKVDPYIALLGGEFIKHGAQQKSKMICTDPNFPGMAAHAAGFEMHEEWYSLKNFPGDLHVLLVQDTTGMKGNMYERPPYPATWARTYGKGRVFYTSMGHREDVWTNPIFQDILVGGIAWAVGDKTADVTPNIGKVAPKANHMPPAK